MAILPRHCRARCRPDMGEKQMGVQMTAEVTEVLVRPGRSRFSIKARFGMVAVPTQTKPVFDCQPRARCEFLYAVQYGSC